MKSIKLAAALMAGAALALSGCGSAGKDSVSEPAVKSPPGVKNVIMMIGDGMGPQQVGLLETYARRAPHSIYQGQPTAIEQLIDKGVLGISNTAPKCSRPAVPVMSIWGRTLPAHV